MPNLYIVATPIGNLEDISLRALRLLKEVGLIAAEDTRKTRRLLSAYDIHTPLTSYYEHNKVTKLDYIIERLGEIDVALVSEAGMPGISDPGYELITAAIDKSIPVIPVPGPSAVVTAVAISGLPTDRFYFAGFLPSRQPARQKVLRELTEIVGSLVLYEAPHRLLATLRDIMEILGDRRIAVCRELTKLHEEVFRGRISNALEYFRVPRGEFTLVIEGYRTREKSTLPDAAAQLQALKRQGMGAKEAVATVASNSGLPRKDIYRAWLNIEKENDNSTNTHSKGRKAQ